MSLTTRLTGTILTTALLSFTSGVVHFSCADSPRYTRSLQQLQNNSTTTRPHSSAIDKPEAAIESPAHVPRDNSAEKKTKSQKYVSYYKTGKASYYGYKFHGRKTANGERYDQNKLTAAHRKLPFGTIVRVTNLNNGKIVVVRINDRGPVKKSRIIDLSVAAAKKIDMIQQGIGTVGLEIME